MLPFPKETGELKVSGSKVNFRYIKFHIVTKWNTRVLTISTLRPGTDLLLSPKEPLSCPTSSGRRSITDLVYSEWKAENQIKRNLLFSVRITHQVLRTSISKGHEGKPATWRPEDFSGVLLEYHFTLVHRYHILTPRLSFLGRGKSKEMEKDSWVGGRVE